MNTKIYRIDPCASPCSLNESCAYIIEKHDIILLFMFHDIYCWVEATALSEDALFLQDKNNESHSKLLTVIYHMFFMFSMFRIQMTAIDKRNAMLLSQIYGKCEAVFFSVGEMARILRKKWYFCQSCITSSITQQQSH